MSVMMGKGTRRAIDPSAAVLVLPRHSCRCLAAVAAYNSVGYRNPSAVV